MPLAYPLPRGNGYPLTGSPRTHGSDPLPFPCPIDPWGRCSLSPARLCYRSPLCSPRRSAPCSHEASGLGWICGRRLREVEGVRGGDGSSGTGDCRTHPGLDPLLEGSRGRRCHYREACLYGGRSRGLAGFSSEGCLGAGGKGLL